MHAVDIESCTRELIAAGADVDAAGLTGTTPLMKACERGAAPCVRALIAAGASLDAQSLSGTTALAVACAGGGDGNQRAQVLDEFPYLQSRRGRLGRIGNVLQAGGVFQHG
eukprot:scaffold9914_cov111-Isochrysis_galbana.AAC.3